MGGKMQILDGGCTACEITHRAFFCKHVNPALLGISDDSDDDRGRSQKIKRVGTQPLPTTFFKGPFSTSFPFSKDLLLNFLVGDDDKFPGLTVEWRRRPCGRLENLFDRRFIHRFRQKIPATSSFFHCSKKV